jgi:tetratricopeptide (TPR) repeat protein
VDVATALEDWLRGESFDLHLREWFTEGRSGEPVARVVRDPGLGAHQIILKFSSENHQDRATKLRQAWRDSPSFRGHLAQVEDHTIPLGEWRGIFMHVAGGDLDAIRPLSEHFDDPDFPEQCAAVVVSVLKEWNENVVRRESGTVAALVHEIMGQRADKAREWASRSGIDISASGRLSRTGWPVSLPNPFTLITGPAGNGQIDDLIVGKAHGDLSGRNILVPTKPVVAADSYVLIDYDRYSAHAPLARDPIHLLVAIALDKFDELGPSLRHGLARVLVDPDTREAAFNLTPFQMISKAIHTASQVLAKQAGWGAEWRKQCLLSLVGVGLQHLGRELRTQDPVAAKEWCCYLAAVAAAAYLDEGGAVAVPAANAASAGRLPDSLVDRHDELTSLRRRLTSGAGGVVVVRGARGIGKTALVQAALNDLGAAGPATRIRQHDVSAIAQLEARTLIDYVAGDADSRWPPRYGGSSLVRLEATLRLLGESQMVIVIDSAENLADQATRKLADPELDEALELLATELGHRITVILVTQHELASHADGTWPTTEEPISVGKLPLPEYIAYLASLDRGRSTAVADLPEESHRTLHTQLQGNPRLAELAHAIVAADNGLDLHALTDRLRLQRAKDVPAYLARVLLEALSPVQQRVLAAVAAFDTPVPPTAVTAILKNETPEQVGPALSTLAASHVIRRVLPDLYYVPPADGRLVLGYLLDDAARSDLFSSAADVLSDLRNGEPRRVADLRVHFAELRALLRAGEYAVAYKVIQDTDDVLREWNCSHLLLEQREEVRGQLGNEFREMANENALGGIYVLRDMIDLADAAYGQALAIAQARRDDAQQMKIYANLAAMYWEWNDTNQALGYYELAHDEATRLLNRQVLMGALEGMADCHRRHGDYHRAMEYADEALTVPKLTDYPDTADAQAFAIALTVAIALKMARWHGELGRADNAARFIEVAHDAANRRHDDWLLAACRDGRANQLLDRGELESAEVEAVKAVDQALLLHDPITLLQARTTLCLIYLKVDRVRDADHEITQAWHHRRKDRSLVVLALLALVARLKGDHPSANERFRRLLAEATGRTERDPADFAAWDFRGFALCGRYLDSRNELDDAVSAFQHARDLTPPTPVLVDRMRFMLERLDQSGPQPDRLRPAIDCLGNYGSRLA